MQGRDELFGPLSGFNMKGDMICTGIDKGLEDGYFFQLGAIRSEYRDCIFKQATLRAAYAQMAVTQRIGCGLCHSGLQSRYNVFRAPVILSAHGYGDG